MNPHTYQMEVKDTENNLSKDTERPRVKPCLGLEFDSTDAAYELYKAYAVKSGFNTRLGQSIRSKIDGSVVSRIFVCSKEGFQARLAVGCLACLKVKLQESGKWTIVRFQENHNHDLESTDNNVELSHTHSNTPTTSSSFVSASQKSETRSMEVMSPQKETELQACLTVAVIAENHTVEDDEGETQVEPYVGMEFNTSGDAYELYMNYAHNLGFGIRIGKLIRSKIDESVIIRRYVCSEEGFQRSRVGCRACIRIKIQDTGKWILDRFEKIHNHELEHPRKDYPSHSHTKVSRSSRLLIDLLHNGSSRKKSKVKKRGGAASLIGKYCRNSKRTRRSNIGSDWYSVLLDYFLFQQSMDSGFFYAVEVYDGKCMSLFWADSKSRFSCSQFGDVVVFDTRYRTSTHIVPFASFVGLNHHKQPVLLGCAIIGDDSKEAFTWLLETWVVAMSGCHPSSIIADQDKVVRQAVKQVFPGIHYRFSTWHIKARSRENLGEVCALHKTFKHEYEKVISQSQTPYEFESSWKALLNKYNLEENDWLKEMYKEREFWVPLYLRGTYFAGITTTGSENLFFGKHLNGRTPLNEFLSRYEKAMEIRLSEAQKEDFVSTHRSVVLRTEEPIEMQCEELYTRNAFLWFREELMASYDYAAIVVYQDGPTVKYLVNENENVEEKFTVKYNCFSEDVHCECKMFESEGMLCKHILAVFLRSEVAAVPSKYILRRWTTDAENGTVRDLSSVPNHQDSANLMTWSLRKEANKYIESGALSLERYKVAFNILQEGRNTLHRMRKRDKTDTLFDSEKVQKKHKDV